jgi:uncharacterized protein (TIGR00299 family) protein
MKTLHFDCFAGISGDMTLGALVGLGVDPEYLRQELGKLGVPGWALEFRRESRCGIAGTRTVVRLDDALEPHGGHRHEHPNRSWKDIRALLSASGIRESAKARALDIFGRLAEAEATVHGVPADEVTFHEVGALDSIIDVVGAALCLDALAPDRVTASPVELGGGTVRCAHGELPVPAPATLLLCKGMLVTTGGFDKEMTTPTGAAILASCVGAFGTAARFTEISTAYGVGSRQMDKPNVLRASLREEADGTAGRGAEPWLTEYLVQLEAAIDDMTGEALGFFMDCLFEQGALDVTLSPCVMKKSRPGTIVAVLCREERLARIRETMFTRSETIGFRETLVKRLSLRREEQVLTGDFGTARAKTVFWGDAPLRAKIEYDDRARVARERGISLDAAAARITEH